MATTALGFLVATPSTLAGFTARVTNSTASAGSATMLYSHTYNSTTCSNAPGGGVTNAVQTAACNGAVYPATSSGSRADTISAVGNISPSLVTQQAAVASCGPVQLANDLSSTDPMLPRGGMTFQETGPLSGGKAITLDGSTAYASNITSAGTGTLLGTASTQGIWFKTSSAAGGMLMGFGTSASNGAQSSYDHVIYVRNDGKLGFGVSTTLGSLTGVSAGTYNDGNWHFAALVVSKSLLTTTATLYADVSGTVQSVASASGLSINLLGYTGYWHLGWDQNGATNAWGTMATYLAGSLANVVVYQSSLTLTDLRTLHTQTSQANWVSAVSGAQASWTLGDTGTTTYTGSLPTIGSNSPCFYVNIHWEFTNPAACIVGPANSSAACTAGTSTRMSTFANNTFYTVARPSPGTNQTSTITLSQNANYAAVSGYLANLIIYAPLTFRYYLGATLTATQWHSTFTWQFAQTPTTTKSTFLL